MNHRPIDPAIKTIIILALGQSGFKHYSALAQRYQQTDHAIRTWPELRQDIESLVQNNNRGPSRKPSSLPRQDRTTMTGTVLRDSPQDNRSARTEYNDSAYGNKLLQIAHRKPVPPLPTPVPPRHHVPLRITQVSLHQLRRRPSTQRTTCSLCQASFPTAAQRHAHYIAVTTIRPSAPASTNKKPQHPPPTSPFLNVRSARSGCSSNASQSSYDSGYDSTASGPGNPPNSDHEEEKTAAATYDARVVTYMTEPDSADLAIPTQPHTPPLIPLSTLHPAHHAHIT